MKKFIIIFSLMVTALAFVSCGSDDEPDLQFDKNTIVEETLQHFFLSENHNIIRTVRHQFIPVLIPPFKIFRTIVIEPSVKIAEILQ